jgi:hypothetical protein
VKSEQAAERSVTEQLNELPVEGWQSL